MRYSNLRFYLLPVLGLLCLASNIWTVLMKLASEAGVVDLTRPRLNSSTIRSMNIKMEIPDSIEVLYSPPRGDRSGSAIMDMLMAHAFAWTLGRHYGGVCGPIYPSAHDHRRLINVLGLGDELLYPLVPEYCETFADSNTSMKVPNHVYLGWKDTQIFSPEWFHFIQQRRKRPLQALLPQRLQLPPSQEDIYEHEHRIIVHIRRGDITPCDDPFYLRYIPNSHYLELIDQYAVRNDTFYNVTIYSEPLSFESWQDFSVSHKSNVAYHLALGDDITDVWIDMLGYNDDPSTMNRTLILSLSTFSIVPALFVDQSSTTVVYTEFGHHPLPHWHLVGSELTKVSHAKTLWLRQELCPSKANHSTDVASRRLLEHRTLR